MKKGTFRVIIVLVGLLFLNIEAAQAGLINKFKVYIHQEFTDYQLVYFIGGLLIFGFLSYIVFTPIFIGTQKWTWFNYYSYNPNRQDYQSKREMVKKISSILKNGDISNQAHS
jgi:hypothetical protein